jgi:hypothetical protein
MVTNTVVLHYRRSLTSACLFLFPLYLRPRLPRLSIFQVVFIVSCSLHCSYCSLFRHSLVLHSFNKTIPSQSEGFHKFYDKFQFLRAATLTFFRAFSSVVRQMLRYNLQRRVTARTFQDSYFFLIVMCVPFCVFCILFVYKCVLYCCHRLSMQLRLNICIVYQIRDVLL